MTVRARFVHIYLPCAREERRQKNTNRRQPGCVGRAPARAYCSSLYTRQPQAHKQKAARDADAGRMDGHGARTCTDGDRLSHNPHHVTGSGQESASEPLTRAGSSAATCDLALVCWPAPRSVVHLLLPRQKRSERMRSQQSIACVIRRRKSWQTRGGERVAHQTLLARRI